MQVLVRTIDEQKNCFGPDEASGETIEECVMNFFSFTGDPDLIEEQKRNMSINLKRCSDIGPEWIHTGTDYVYTLGDMVYLIEVLN